ncbi:hypothetical protein YC68_23745, partial [Vibrio parahaemolyticus]
DNLLPEQGINLLFFFFFIYYCLIFNVIIYEILQVPSVLRPDLVESASHGVTSRRCLNVFVNAGIFTLNIVFVLDNNVGPVEYSETLSCVI